MLSQIEDAATSLLCDDAPELACRWLKKKQESSLIAGNTNTLCVFNNTVAGCDAQDLLNWYFFFNPSN